MTFCCCFLIHENFFRNFRFVCRWFCCSFFKERVNCQKIKTSFSRFRRLASRLMLFLLHIWFHWGMNPALSPSFPEKGKRRQKKVLALVPGSEKIEQVRVYLRTLRHHFTLSKVHSHAFEMDEVRVFWKYHVNNYYHNKQFSLLLAVLEGIHIRTIYRVLGCNFFNIGISLIWRARALVKLERSCRILCVVP